MLNGKIRRQREAGRLEREREGAEEREEGWQINKSLQRKTAGVKFELQDFVSKDILKKGGEKRPSAGLHFVLY